jgi:hypothetical protein
MFLCTSLAFADFLQPRFLLFWAGGVEKVAFVSTYICLYPNSTRFPPASVSDGGIPENAQKLSPASI